MQGRAQRTFQRSGLFRFRDAGTRERLGDRAADFGERPLWHEGTVQNYSRDVKTQRVMRDILKIAQAAAITPPAEWRAGS
jgi:hypothetical protein